MTTQNAKLGKCKIVPKRHRNFAFYILRFRLSAGISFIEVIVYVALLGLISVLLGNFMLQIGSAYGRARAARETVASGRTVITEVVRAIEEASQVYAPTSAFQVPMGALSLITSAGVPSGHTAQYVDFWADNGILYMRDEAGNQRALSAPWVRVTKFYLEEMRQGIGRESIRITLRIAYAHPRFPESIELHTAAAIRGNY